MTHNMIAIIDLGGTQSARIAREIRQLGLYSEIHPHDIAAQALAALPGHLRRDPQRRRKPHCKRPRGGS